jgi:hypothetical protein
MICILTLEAPRFYNIQNDNYKLERLEFNKRITVLVSLTSFVELWEWNFREGIALGQGLGSGGWGTSALHWGLEIGAKAGKGRGE